MTVVDVVEVVEVMPVVVVVVGDGVAFVAHEMVTKKLVAKQWNCSTVRKQRTGAQRSCCLATPSNLTQL